MLLSAYLMSLTDGERATLFNPMTKFDEEGATLLMKRGLRLPNAYCSYRF